MKTVNIWGLLRNGRIEEGLSHLEGLYTTEPSPSHTMELGVAYLWVGCYQEAWKHFHRTNETLSVGTTDFYGMAGTAKWCLGEYETAVANWVSGLKAGFADTAGLGIHLPMLLFFASNVKPGLFARKAAEGLLTKRCKDIRVEEWPGPMAKYILGQIGDAVLRDCLVGVDEPDTFGRNWLYKFYLAVGDYDFNNQHTFRRKMQELTDTNGPEWKDETYFLDRMWSEEFFLARHEAALT